MKISNNKIKLGFYAYCSIITLVIFLATAIAEHILPTQTLVKSLLVLSLIVFIVGVGIYITNQCIAKPVIIFLLGAMVVGVFVVYITRDFNIEYNIYNQYRNNLNKYIDTPYKEDFELNTNIDDDGLIHATYWQSIFKTGLINKNFNLMGKACLIWWKNFDKETYNSNKYYRPINIENQKENFDFLTGDVAILNNQSYVFYRNYKGQDIWMTCDNYVRKIYFANKKYLDKVSVIYRACELEKLR